MDEEHEYDPLQRSKARAIETIAEHLGSLHALLEVQPPERQPGGSTGLNREIGAHLDRAGGCLDGVYEGTLPSRRRVYGGTVRFHLESANALAEEHLASEGEEGKARLLLKRALSAYERGS